MGECSSARGLSSEDKDELYLRNGIVYTKKQILTLKSIVSLLQRNFGIWLMQNSRLMAKEDYVLRTRQSKEVV